MTRILRFLIWCISTKSLHSVGISKVISIFTRIIFSCQVSPGVTVGKRLTLAYGGLGIVIHGSSVIGNDVTIGTNVTLGGNFGRGGLPTIGNGVYIATGAKVLGGVNIGNHAIIGANAVVVKDVAAETTVVGVPAQELK